MGSYNDTGDVDQVRRANSLFLLGLFGLQYAKCELAKRCAKKLTTYGLGVLLDFGGCVGLRLRPLKVFCHNRFSDRNYNMGPLKTYLHVVARLERRWDGFRLYQIHP